MSTSEFWSNILEQDEELLWTGQPKPRVHWRNWRLYAPAPMSAAGLMAAAWFIISTSGSEGDMWLLILPALLVLIPARATWQQLQTYAATRYALTNQRALMFHVSGQQTRVRAYPKSAIKTPELTSTMPASVSFVRDDTGKKRKLGFEYIETSRELMPHLARIS